MEVKNMKIKMWYDEEVDILYISLKEGKAVDSEEVQENVRVEYDENGEIVGIEICNISRYLAKSIAEKLRRIKV